MDTSTLKKFAQEARRQLREQVHSKLDLVLKEGSLARRERANSVENLEEAISGTSKETVIDMIAYIWFNRLCALRFMDVNHHTKIKAVSSGEGFTQPEILAEAKQGHIDDSLGNFINKKKVLGILSGSEPSKDPEQEAYRLLLVATCNYYNHIMPFLFQKIDDYTELLIPADLLSESSILTSVRKAMTDDACQNVEIIGWLYQFYISEKKDEVFEGLKKNKKITPENIPAATQLFTPHWIVRYLVENSLGRLWMLNHPQSKLVEQMEYYIKPEETEANFLKISNPEEIRVCDPACGSGHMLTYAFDLLYAIYEEEGYEATVIPRFILENNLFGIEIDERAGELAAFALTMKAREKYKRFFSKAIQPNICVLENIIIDEGKLNEYMDFIGRDLFTAPLQATLRQFEEADNFGSLIRPDTTDVARMLKILKDKDITGQLFLNATHQQVLQVLQQADYLSRKYHVVIANPPYMGSKGMNGRLGAWVKDNYPDSKSDLFAMFIERNLDLSIKHGLVAMITMQSWMFLSSFEKLRNNLLRMNTIVSMAHFGSRAFDNIGGEVVSTTSFVITSNMCPDHKGDYIRLIEGNSEAEKETAILEAIKNQDCGWFFHVSASSFKKIPGSPIAYWIQKKEVDIFSDNKLLSDTCYPKKGLDTGCNAIFLRFWHETAWDKLGFNSKAKWFPYSKGGTFRRWYGNREYVVNWEDDGEDIHKYNNVPKNYNGAPVRAKRFYFREGYTWTTVSSGGFSARFVPEGAIFDNGGCTLFCDEKLHYYGALLNSVISGRYLTLISPTLNFQPGDVGKIPVVKLQNTLPITERVNELTRISRTDWNAYETSWGFTSLSLLQSNYRQSTIAATYKKLHTHWQEVTLEMQRLEEENNRIFIEAYGLQDELTADVLLTKITLTCNPHYRYEIDKNESEREALLLADTMKEFISYAVGCMFGRYSLDKPGLFLANQGETI